MTEDDVRALLLKRAKRFAKNKGSSGVNGWCEAHGVSRGHANEFVNGKRAPTTDVLNALGLERRYGRKRRGAQIEWVLKDGTRPTTVCRRCGRKTPMLVHGLGFDCCAPNDARAEGTTP